MWLGWYACVYYVVTTNYMYLFVLVVNSDKNFEDIIRPAMDRVCLEPQDNTDNTGNQLLELKVRFPPFHFYVHISW